ncbi:MAG: PD-(D/E)XK nuclease family protein [Solirubrobacteraceae bacterium]
MALTLITGPANSAKAQEVLVRYRAQLRRGEPILVVPTAVDAEHYRRELAATDSFGVRVEQFSGLMRTLAARTGVAANVLDGPARERIARAALTRVDLRELARPAASPGFAGALCDFFAEVGASGAGAARLRVALRAWGRRASLCEEICALYSEYCARLEAGGWCDPEQAAIRAIDALRAEPWRWGQGSVFVYGFDDLDVLQLDAVRALADAAPVCLSLPYEAGRAAFAGRGSTFSDLVAGAVEHVDLEPRADYYEPASRAALHHLERTLFEPPEGERVACAGAVTLLACGGERAECELVGSELRGLLAEGFEPEQIALCTRESTRLLEEVLLEQGIPYTLERRRRFGETALGRALICGLRAAQPAGTADDLLGWLRAPGFVRRSELVDRFEAQLRRGKLSGAAGAAAAWPHWPLDRLRALAQVEGLAPLAAVERELQALMGAAHPREAAPLHDGAAAAVALRALRSLGAVAERDPALAPSAAELIDALDALEVREPARRGVGRILVCDPLSLRARRVRALVLCGLNEGIFPAPDRGEPFFTDAERGEIRAASGLRLARREATLDAERYLFYATVSRPRERLLVSWRSCTDAGEAVQGSPFLAELEARLCEPRRRDRALGEVSWEPGVEPPGPRAAARAAALSGPRMRERSIRALRSAPGAADDWSASALESWLQCPVKWLVERRLRLEALEPEPEQLERGRLAHAVLERVLSGAAGAQGIDGARERMGEVLSELGARSTVSAPEQRRLRADLERYLESAAAWGSDYVAAHFELEFERVELAPGFALRGRIDRVDLSPEGDRAIVYDYKGANPPPAARWLSDGRLQMGLYMLAASSVLDVEVVGGMYQALRAELAARGLLLAGADPSAQAFRNDRLAAPEFNELLAAVLAAAQEAAGEIAAGALESRPRTCAYEGGCRYPSLCRAEPVSGC